MRHMRKEIQPYLLSADAERTLLPHARFALRMYRFRHFYWTLVICSALVCAISVVLAIVANVLVGLCAAIATATAYHYFKTYALDHYLGIRCRAVECGLCIESVSAKGEDSLYLPTDLCGMRVRALGKSPFAVAGNESLRTVTFSGSHKEWEALSRDCELPCLTVECDVSIADLATLLQASAEMPETEGTV